MRGKPPGTWEKHVLSTRTAGAGAGGEVCSMYGAAARAALGREDGRFGVSFWVTPWLRSGKWMEGANILKS